MKHLLPRAFFVIGVLSIFTTALSADQDQCRDIARRAYDNCIFGGGPETGGGESGCLNQTRCEQICLGGKRLCRVFDCNGLIKTSYEENCIEQPPTFECSDCNYSRSMPTPDRLYLTEEYCFEISETTNGQVRTIDRRCALDRAGTAYTAEDECNKLRKSNPHCRQRR